MFLPSCILSRGSHEISLLLLLFCRHAVSDCLYDDLDTPVMDVNVTDPSKNSTCHQTKYNSIINSNIITDCSVEMWKSTVKPLWDKKLENDWWGVAEEHNKIMEKVKTDNISWEQLCYHPSYFTYMECSASGESGKNETNDRKTQCQCYPRFEGLILDEDGICRVKEGFECGYDEICEIDMKCVQGRCKRNENNSARLIYISVELLLVQVLFPFDL